MTQADLPLEKPVRKLRKLNASQLFKLTLFVEKSYVSSGKTDKAFAVEAAQELGFPVSESSISTARETLGLISNRDAAREEKKVAVPLFDPSPILKRLDTAEAQIRKLFALSTENSHAWTEPTDAQILKIKAQVYENHPTADHEFRIIQIVRECFRLSAKGEKSCQNK